MELIYVTKSALLLQTPTGQDLDNNHTLDISSDLYYFSYDYIFLFTVLFC